MGRSHHAIIRSGNRIDALGGRDSSNSALSQVAEFNAITQAWTDTTHKLHSSNTSELTSTLFPTTSLDCVPNALAGYQPPIQESSADTLKSQTLTIGSLYFSETKTREQDTSTAPAAHCLYTEENEELLPASSFSIMLGVHNNGEQ